MLFLDQIIGDSSEPVMAEQIHRLSRLGHVEYITLEPNNLHRSRMRVFTDTGRECAISLPRDQILRNGSVLLCGPELAVVVCSCEPKVLRFRPADTLAALELGYYAGNMHWAAKFETGDLLLVLNGPEFEYLDRLEPLLVSGKIQQIIV
jgi:urease accessory protein